LYHWEKECNTYINERMYKPIILDTHNLEGITSLDEIRFKKSKNLFIVNYRTLIKYEPLIN